MTLKEKDTKVIDLIDLSKTIWGKRKKILLWALYGFAIGIVIWLSKPNIYTSSTIIIPEGTSKSKSSSGMGAMASLVGIDISSSQNDAISEKLYPRIIKSTPFLLEFSEIPVKYDDQEMFLYEYLDQKQQHAWWSYAFKAPFQLIGWVGSLVKEKEEKPFKLSQSKQESFAYDLQKLIFLESKKEDGVIEISVRMQDPLIAATVADSLFCKLQRYMTTYRTERTRSNLVSSVAMLENAKMKYYAADSVYAKALDKNQNLVSKSAQVKLDRLMNEKDLALNVYQQLASQVEMNRVKLQEDLPIATVIEPVKIPLGPSSPNMIITIFMFTFLGGFLCTAIIITKELIK